MDKRILVVDDDKSICENLKFFLSNRDFNVTVAVGGEKALEILDSAAFPVIVTDIKMPFVDGKKVLKYAISKYPETKVIVLTGFGEDHEKNECKKLGACDYVVKPIRLKELYEKINKFY